MPLHLHTPLLDSRPLGLAAGRTVRLKLELLQPSGSFKTRGIGAACEAQAARGARRFVSSSGGNAGIAVAYAGRKLSIPVLVVVPLTTTPRAIALIRAEGAEVIVHGESWQEANHHATARLGADDAFLHPFDDPLIWGGHATMIDELAADRPKPGAIVVSVGGGGLLCGVVEGLHRNHWADVPVIAVETDGAASLAASVVAGERVTLPAITSIATSLGAKTVCEQAFEWTRRHPIETVVVTDRAAVTACLRFVDDHRLVVEPACGAALALAYDRAASLDRFDDVVVIACGGATATLDQLRAWRASGR